MPSNIDNKLIKSFFGEKLIKRDVPKQVKNLLDEEDINILSELGMPENVLDCTFSSPISKNENGLLIGKLHDDDIFIDLVGKEIFVNDKSFFLARSLRILVLQLYLIESFWKDFVKNNKLGNYQQNHKNYAKYLETSLQDIDQELFEKDNSYFWGAMIEDIELGVVG